MATLVGSAVGTEADPSVITLPTHDEGDLIVVYGFHRGGTAGTNWTCGTGYTEADHLDNAIADSTYRCSMVVFYKVAGASESNPSVDCGTETVLACCDVFALEAGESWTFKDVHLEGTGTTADQTSLAIGPTASIDTDDNLIASCVGFKPDTSVGGESPPDRPEWSTINLTRTNVQYMVSGTARAISSAWGTDAATGTKTSTCDWFDWEPNNDGWRSQIGAIAVFALTAGGGATTRRYGLTTLGVS